MVSVSGSSSLQHQGEASPTQSPRDDHGALSDGFLFAYVIWYGKEFKVCLQLIKIQHKLYILISFICWGLWKAGISLHTSCHSDSRITSFQKRYTYYKNKIHFYLKWATAACNESIKKAKVEDNSSWWLYSLYFTFPVDPTLSSRINQVLINLLSFDNLKAGVSTLFISFSISMQSSLHDIILPYNDSKNLTEINGDNIIPESRHSICRNILAIKTSHCVPFPSRGSLTFLWFLKASDQ